jgi:hypothetical protein
MTIDLERLTLTGRRLCIAAPEATLICAEAESSSLPRPCLGPLFDQPVGGRTELRQKSRPNPMRID